MQVPDIPLPPAYKPGVVLQDGLSVTAELRDTMADMIRQMNKGIVTLPDLRGGKKSAAKS